jgi:orotate phosphoribosyltransferase
LGADSFAQGVALLSGTEWFVARKEAKDHGTRRRIEGADLKDGVSVLLVDDVVTTGGSMLVALDTIEAAGATVVMAVALVDRGEIARPRFEERGVRYRPLVTFRDLEIRPVTYGPVDAEAVG